MKDKNKKTCKGCKGLCCKYVAIEIDCPETLKDFENIKWYVCHKNINVYVDEDYEWHIEFLTPCEFLDEEYQCKIYDQRPKICKEYNMDECLFHNHYKERYHFKIIKDIEKYIREIFKKDKHRIPK